LHSFSQITAPQVLTQSISSHKPAGGTTAVQSFEVGQLVFPRDFGHPRDHGVLPPLSCLNIFE